MYYQNSRPQYCYSDYETSPAKKRRRLIFWIPFIILCAVALFSPQEPSALSMDYDTEICISDTLGVIGDPDSLYAALERFRDTTGITPCIVTVSNETWEPYYAGLDSWAFDVYVNNFSDERHWLLAYSQPELPDAAFVDWYWEGVQGDETDAILTEEAADRFGLQLQKYLTNSDCTVGEALTTAFLEITPGLMEAAKPDAYDIFASLLILALIVWIAIRRTGILSKAPQRPAGIPSQATAVSRAAKEITCEYCDGVYLSDSFNCPHCGAGRPACSE